MNVRNENIGIVVSVLVMMLGCWIADWDPSEDAAAIIVTASFLAGLATITGLHQRERQHPDGGR